MMALLLDLLLNKQASVEDVVLWMSHKQNETNRYLFDNYESLCIEFLPFFLNYLREQTSGLVQNLQPTGLTPKKAKSHQAQKKTDSNVQKRSPTSRARLFSPPSPANACETNPPNSSNLSNRLGVVEGKKSLEKTPKTVRFESRQPSQLNFGHFFDFDGMSANVKKKVSHSTSRNNSAYRRSPESLNQKVNLNDLGSFPTVGESLAKTKERKQKIKPVTLVTNRTTGIVQNKAFLTEEKDEKYDVDMKTAMKGARHKLENESDGTCFKATEIIEIAKASSLKVSFQEEIDLLVALYCAFLDANFIPNLTVELYFLIQLLTVRNETIKNSLFCKNHYLTTVHNCVYFAVKVLSHQHRLLNLLDRTTTKLLIDNPRIEAFDPNLKSDLLSMYNCENKKFGDRSFGNSLGIVSFQSDTDNRNNFPDDQTFHTFRKQRDSFYEILRDWENNHTNPNWSMDNNLGNKIRNVIGLCPDPSVYSHLARLFLGQLIAMCKGDIALDKNEELDLLDDLKRKNPEKFKRLQERFITPLTVGGPSPLPSLAGPEEFFCDFVTVASCPAFNQHVIDNLVSQLMQLNDLEVTLSDNESCNKNPDGDLKQNYTSTLLTGRSLAKFLGFLIFLPYKSHEKVPYEVQANSIIMRNRLPFIFDLKKLFHDAKCSHKLILTIPWLVEFLSMIDASALYVKSINEVFKELVQLYRSLLIVKEEKNSLNNLFLLTLLGWLFEIHNISSTMFFTNMSFEAEDESIKSYNSDSSNGIYLDSLDLVDHQILYTCCPYLGELKVVLNDFASGLTNRSSVIKKITPVSAKNSTKAAVPIKHLELQLEENFFLNQPASLKKTVEFIAERMTSNIIMQVKKKFIPEMRSDGFKKTHNGFLEILREGERIQSKLMELKQSLTTEMCAHILSQTSEYLERYFNERIELSLKLLLVEETDTNVISVCSQIALRLSKEKVMQWLTTYVTPTLFDDDLQNEIEKLKKINATFPEKLPEYKPPSLPCRQFSQEYANFSPTDVLISFKSFIRDLYMGHVFKCSEDVDKIIADFQLLSTPVVDIPLSVKNSVVSWSIELFVTIVFFSPHLITENHKNYFFGLWKTSKSNPFISYDVLCPHNLTLLRNQSANTTTWNEYESFLSRLLSEELLVTKVFESRCLEVLKQETSLDLVQCLSKCLHNVVNVYRSQDDNTNEFDTLMHLLLLHPA